jgi:hypothetical protein
MFAPTEIALGYSLVVVGVAVFLAPVLVRMADNYAPDASMKLEEGLAHESV